MADFTVFPSTKITRENLLTINRIHQAYDGIVSIEDFPLSYGQEGDNLVVYIGAGRAMVQGRLIELTAPVAYRLEINELSLEFGAYIKLVLETNGLEDSVFITQDDDEAYAFPDEGRYEIDLCHVQLQETDAGYRIIRTTDRRRPISIPATDITEHMVNCDKKYASFYSLRNEILHLQISTTTMQGAELYQDGDGSDMEFEICRIPIVVPVYSTGQIYTSQGMKGIRFRYDNFESMLIVTLVADPADSYEISGYVSVPIIV